MSIDFRSQSSLIIMDNEQITYSITIFLVPGMHFSQLKYLIMAL